ncbi:MAG: ABC transporter ATP-binding protein/permease, partial [Actinomycetota bacterium]|nr:ABC transporter ATP-binding protein/permease [Actinomycetota bacterium]
GCSHCRRPGSMPEWARSVRLLWSAMRRDNPRRALAAVVLGLLVNVGGRPLAALCLKLVVDGAADGDRTGVVIAAAALAGSLLVQGALSAVVGTLLSDLHESSARVLIGELMDLSSGVPGIEHHERPEYADRIDLLRGQGRLLTDFVGVFTTTVGLLAQIAVTVVLLGSVHLALLLLPVLAVPTVWAGTRASRITEAADEATAERRRREDHLFAVLTTPGPAKEARVFGVSDELITRHRRIWADVAAEVAAARLRAGFVRMLGWLPFAAGYVGSIFLAVVQVRRGAASPGDVLLVIALAADVSDQVSRAASVANQSSGILQAVGRFRWLADYAAAARVPPADPAPVPERLVDGIAFEGVGFRYPGTEADVLSGVDVRLPAGSVVAVVGENGAGKTTLVKLLTRCYEPTTGHITVDGTDLRRLDVDEWRRRISAGFQDFVRLQLLLREAVGVGDLPRMDDRAVVGAALVAAQAGDLPDLLPAGMDTQLGKELPNGCELSEGQWQKVAISRALMADLPLLLVLDEPTSGLDPDAEHALFQRYASAAVQAGSAVGAVTVLISHRFSTVRLADHIVVVDDGRVVEQGTHDDLMAAGGLYAELYGLQARSYR